MDTPKSPIFEPDSLRDTTETNINALTSAVDDVMKSDPTTPNDITYPVYGEKFEDLNGRQKDNVLGLMRGEIPSRVVVLLEIVAASQIAADVREQLGSTLQAYGIDEFIAAANKALGNAA